ncbi:hypothetical protein GCM10011502_29900 [Oceanisphaera marina]|uniref:Uncharacterized protein n=1 Tax=Oceanisphaera marina TaxID=2017550 RepID=A0ABQ1J0G2_9GAMM|nr:hypothetical protein GCM10011502_29900 [Oceanisphaera marina]
MDGWKITAYFNGFLGKKTNCSPSSALGEQRLKKNTTASLLFKESIRLLDIAQYSGIGKHAEFASTSAKNAPMCRTPVPLPATGHFSDA